MEMRNELTIVPIQINLSWENIALNIETIDGIIQSFSEEVDLFVLPEMFSTGFSMNPNVYAEGMEGLAVNAMKKWAKQKNSAVCGSFMCKENGSYFNRFIWVEPNETIYNYDKAHLFRMGEEQQHYSAGKSRIIIQYKGWNIAPFVCYDLRFPVWIRRTPNFDYDLLLFVANWPDKRVKHWDALAIARAIENQTYVCAVNRIGQDGNGIDHSGHSKIIDPMGEIIHFSENEESYPIIKVNKEHLTHYRNIFPVGLDADKFELS